MNRTRERRFSLTAGQLQNIPIVRNKGEQMKLEKKQRFLEKAREKESIGLLNKRKELIDLKTLPTQLSKFSETRVIPCRPNLDTKQHDSSQDLKTGRMNRFAFARSKSLTGLSTIPPITQINGSNRDSKRPRYCTHFRLSRSFDSSRNCPRCRSTFGDFVSQSNDGIHSSEKDPNNEEESGRNLRDILPPACLLPLYKQNTKSLKEKSKSKLEGKLAISKSCSVSDLSHCRYLRLFPHKW